LRNVHAHELICFGASAGQGNLALVVEGAGPELDARLQLARERAATCVFLDAAADGGIEVDFVYPHMRSPLCLHATLAVAALLFGRRPDVRTIAVETAMKRQRLELSREGTDYFVRLAPQPAPSVDMSGEQLMALLGATGAMQIASVGSPKLLVEVEDVSALYDLKPDLPAIAAWGKAHGVNGIYAWCRRADGAFEGRNFNHLDPALEDAATGVAAGALSVALGRGIVLHQGRATGRDCLIRTRLDGATLLVGGAASFV
jgi:PhzF family phenazine biosynthesis protein